MQTQLSVCLQEAEYPDINILTEKVGSVSLWCRPLLVISVKRPLLSLPQQNLYAHRLPLMGSLALRTARASPWASQST